MLGHLHTDSKTFSGTFAETTSPEHQLHWIIENCKVVRAANGTGVIVEATKIASSKLDLLRLAMPYCLNYRKQLM